MTDINQRLKEWNDTIAEGVELRRKLRSSAIKRRDGIGRRLLLRLAAFTDRWVERGKKWRDDDIQDD